MTTFNGTDGSRVIARYRFAVEGFEYTIWCNQYEETLQEMGFTLRALGHTVYDTFHVTSTGTYCV